MIFRFLFGTIFLAFGLGVKLGQGVENMVSGWWFLGLGILLLIWSWAMNELEVED